PPRVSRRRNRHQCDRKQRQFRSVSIEDRENQKVPHEHRDNGQRIDEYNQPRGVRTGASNEPGEFGDGRSAVYKPAKECSVEQAANAIKPQQHVVDKADGRDQNHRQPVFTRVEQCPWIYKPVRKNRIDNESNERQQNGPSHFLSGQFPGESGELWFKGKKQSHDNCGRRWREQMTLPDENTERVCYQQCAGGCGFQLFLRAGIADAGRGDERDDTGKASQREAVRNQLGRCAKEGGERECAAAELLVRPLPLKANQQTRADRQQQSHRNLKRRKGRGHPFKSRYGHSEWGQSQCNKEKATVARRLDAFAMRFHRPVWNRELRPNPLLSRGRPLSTRARGRSSTARTSVAIENS